MKKFEIEIELNLNSITDTLKNLSKGVKEQRSAKLIDIEGKGFSITIVCNKDDHFLSKWKKAMFVDTGTFTMTLKGPNVKQTSIEEFGDTDEEKPKTKGELRDEINKTDVVAPRTIDETLSANIFEDQNEPKRAYYNRDGQMFKTKAFEKFLETYKN